MGQLEVHLDRMKLGDTGYFGVTAICVSICNATQQMWHSTYNLCNGDSHYKFTNNGLRFTYLFLDLVSAVPM